MVHRMLLFLLFFFLLQSSSSQPLNSTTDLAALFSLRASLGLRSKDWPRKTDPCSVWTGVKCRSGRVVSLNLSGLRRTRRGRLNPKFAVDGLQNLTRLESFNSTGFALSGPIPDGFGRGLPVSVTVLVLRSANITGNIPPTLGQLSNLTVLDLSSNFLSGFIPLALGKIPKLKTLIVSNNRLTGPVPALLGDLSFLLVLDLSFNSLFGILPDELENSRSLQELKLGNNSLTGTLPGSLFSGLSRLQLLSRSHNNFSGSLPYSIWSLELQFLDVSFNNLTGTLPNLIPVNFNPNASTAIFNLSNNLYYGSISSAFGLLFRRFSIVDFSDNYFQGTVPLGDKNMNASFELNCFRNASNQRSPVDCEEFYKGKGIPYDGPVTPNPTPPPTSSNGKRSQRWKYILAGVLGSLGLVILILVILLCLMRPRARTADQGGIGTNAIPSGIGPPPPSGVSKNLPAIGEAFTYEQLVRATSEFSSVNLIKNGHSGDLYHGVLEGGFSVVVKRIDVNTERREGYIVELDLFTKASHARLVPFLGHCSEKENEKFLIYKYMPHGDLSNALYRKPRQDEEGLKSLDWITRLKIAIGVAEALCFLHHECNPPLVHRDVQASSILLDDKFEVRLGSLSEVCAQEGDGHQSVISRFLQKSQTSEQGASGSPAAACVYDVYCMGKVLLELVTGNLGISRSNDVATSEWLDRTIRCISIYEKESIMKIVDPSLIVDEDLLEEVWAMAVVAKSCMNPKPSKRPLMRYVLKALENPLKVMRVDSRSSSARLRTTSSRGSWHGAFFGSWRQSSSDMREDGSLKRSSTGTSHGSGGDHSFSYKRPPKEIFPEPSGEAVAEKD